MYYDDDGQPMAQTMDLMVEQDTITGMRTQFENMLKALDEPVLDESDIVDNTVNTKTIEDRVLSLEMENAEFRDRLKELGDEILDKEKNFTNKLPAGLSGEEIDGMYTDDELEKWGSPPKEWGHSPKKDEKRGL